jgi:flagellar basal body rod protein FlgG
MSHGIYAALSGAVAQEAALDCAAQDLANASTGGYRGAHPVFHEVMSRQPGGAGGPVRFTAMTGTTVDVSAGEVRETGRPLDLALAPSDFLAVGTARGERYTRAGALHVAVDGTLQCGSGDAVLGEDQKPIKLQPGVAVTLDADGTVRAGGAASGRLRVVSFARPEAMTREGGALLGAGGAGAPAASGRPIAVGALEGSNASPIRGMTELMRVTRLFEAFQRTIDAFNEADRKVVNTVPSR